jgi:hypothetical protein
MKVGFSVSPEQFEWHGGSMVFNCFTVAAEHFPILGPSAWQNRHNLPNVLYPASDAGHFADHNPQSYRNRFLATCVQFFLKNVGYNRNIMDEL